VLIYLSPVLQQKKVFPTFHYALRPGGHLLLGSSETAGNTSELFEVVDKRLKIYVKSPGTSHLRLDFPLPSPQVGHGAVERPPERAAESETHNLHREADTVALARYAPPGVIINEDMQIIEFRGQTGPYLEHPPGEPSYHLLKMAREGLALELRASIHKAQKTGQVVRSGAVELRLHGGARQVQVEVTPLRTGQRVGEPGPAPRARYLLISFDEAAPRKEPPAKEGAPAVASAADGRQVAKLRQELAATREYLQSIIEEMEATNEELQSANEEILSSNEELQSINEELETAKEELQSSNEELTTVNEELRCRNAELTQANNDLNNALSSVNLPIIMLSADLRIRRFTPAAERVLHLIPSDVGRPIGDLRLKIDVPDLQSLLAEVVDGAKSSTREVQDREGRWHSMRVRPYRTADNKIEGALLILVDIDESKRALEALGALHRYAEALIETVHEPLVVLDEALRVHRANASFYKTFRLTRERADGNFIYDLSDALEVRSLRLLLEEILPKDTVLRDYSIEHDIPETGRKVFLLNARQVRRAEGPADRILLAFRDVTDRPG
jgi:two-component system CheB/CheR fusion protein